ncbi:cytochrome P450 family protein [Myxococcus stipitatus DSM 14675]|uniref:Cytochrome P450 family protein n=1 Tax=Myxococcus stipitatus (strain DSM 14675 / JCM 12634 / Mx s8) TaxID=1278073 RepID=L7UDI1_MYXSD|nr:cytochrome P450 family protein [Myxococcus stipitatus DSM 14675]
MHKTELADLASPITYGRAIPHETFEHLRREAPVYFHQEPDGGTGFWAITRHEDIITISRDPATYSSYRGGTSIEDYSQEDLSLIRFMMLNMDPPQHVKYRRLVSSGFTPVAITYLEPRIRAVTKEILDKVVHEREFDFVTSIAAELPLQVIAELVGIPREERHQLFAWSNRLIDYDDSGRARSFDDAKMAAMEMWQYANQLAARNQGREGKDLVSVLMNAEVDGEKLNEAEFDAFFLLLIVAGNETTRNLISGGMLALMEHPEELARLRANPALLPTAVEEMLRWVSPVVCFRRTVTRDTVLRGQQLREGDKVVLFYPSANRDESVFENPGRFDISRFPNEHIAFGIGQHYCLGTSLARLEIRVMFEELLKRLDGLELAGPVERRRSKLVNAIRAMPVRRPPSSRPREGARENQEGTACEPSMRG